jgi:hypothetical protein
MHPPPQERHTVSLRGKWVLGVKGRHRKIWRAHKKQKIGSRGDSITPGIGRNGGKEIGHPKMGVQVESDLVKR